MGTTPTGRPYLAMALLGEQQMDRSSHRGWQSGEELHPSLSQILQDQRLQTRRACSKDYPYDSAALNQCRIHSLSTTSSTILLQLEHHRRYLSRA